MAMATKAFLAAQTISDPPLTNVPHASSIMQKPSWPTYSPSAAVSTGAALFAGANPISLLFASI